MSKLIFDTVRPWLDGEGFTPARIAALDRAIAGEAAPTAKGLTARIAIELIAHEGIVPEAYRDSVGVWTWSVGLATTGGWPVMEYKDNPASLETCLAAYIHALKTEYLPAVLKAFPEPLAEHELGALLSFHYNTGAVARLKPNNMNFMLWKKPAVLVHRRTRERDLYLHGKWTGDGMATVYEVSKPDYQPVRGKRVNVAPIIEGLLA